MIVQAFVREEVKGWEEEWTHLVWLRFILIHKSDIFEKEALVELVLRDKEEEELLVFEIREDLLDFVKLAFPYVVEAGEMAVKS